ncbi:ABC transporter permease [Acidipropionibacterium timonense]|uniref:ABC transporter permease n=1 Tax=Acidipropionibacterium timonense TaxID=2161818 RepID=UPI00102FCDE3|nr:ABC transporter permease [Acidipropionibacterium timonense]
MITYALLDFRRMVRNTGTIVFAILMPVGFYLIFGAAQSFDDADLDHGNVKAVIMASMAAYGAIVSASSLGSQAALEQERGWGRQLALTPMTPLRYVVAKAMAVECVALAPVVLVFLVGALTGAHIDGVRWLWTLLLCWVCAMPFTLLGLTMALLVRSESATSISAFCIVALAFLGNMFVPLSGFMLKLARFTPMYGPNQLARVPIMGSYITSGNSMVAEPLWRPIVGIVVWTIVLGALAVMAGRRRQER